ncbi:MerR family transcriptional regulator [Paenibacillus aceris]|uniref:Outer membrane murein-binding lipoprotein Lpp n=1 Tax=Paenibacillus aceris TaxID=869555 RepID=A0ABS4HWX7_9BACL|nr:MerR family transcriptional regulator [Paenibacillus aceris]MBP1963157.1 outer membrane murein-binding lipoprotein Lpp [Paenibacillus aceris]NHW38725.1 hypothetical protein [Paenibacillus aceris]
MKRTYKVNEIASKIGKTRAAVMEWSNHFREFLPTIVVGRSIRYTEEAIEIFQIISKMKDDNKPLKLIREHLQDMRQKVYISLHKEEKPLLPTPTIMPDSNLPHGVNKSTFPPIEIKSNLLLSHETMELRNMVHLLTQKIEAHKASGNVKDHIDDLNQKVGVSSTAGGRFLSPIKDNSNSQFIQLTNEVTELRNIVHVLTERVTELFEQDISSEVASTIELLNRQFEGVSVEVTGLRNVIQIIQQKVTKVSEQDLKGEMLTAVTELLNQRYEGVSEDVNELRNMNLHTQKVTDKRYDAISEEVTELRSVIQMLAQKVTEVSEQDLKGEMLTTVTELLNQRYEGVSEHVNELRNMNLHTQEVADKRYDAISEEVTELRSVIQILAQKVGEMVEQDVSGEMHVREESLNRRMQNISEEVAGLGNLIQTTELLSRRYNDISEQLRTQQLLLDKIAKFLGYQVIK